jgi:glycosyltransferase involved in cell wall biosynthesis
MRLLIIGHTAHYLREGEIVGWGPTVKEIRWLARAFDSVTHVACFHPGPAPKSALAYNTDKVRLVPVPPAGGRTLRDKSRVILWAPKYLEAILRNIGEADVIHVRCPGNIAMYAIVVLLFVGRKQQWVKYAGNWVQTGRMPISFIFQRWWLQKGLSHGPVTINGRWENQPNHVFSFVNPSMTLQDIRVARSLSLNKRLEKPIRIVFAGRTETAKGVGRSLEILRGVLQYSRDVQLDILGDGPERSKFERMSQDLGLAEKVRFHGWLPHDQVRDFLAHSHFMLLPSASEGWPKVLSEAMSYGVVPIASNISAIPQILEETKAGVALPADDINGFVKMIIEIMRDFPKWKEMSLSGIDAASDFTYERYLLALDEMFISAYGFSPLKQDVLMEVRHQLEALLSESPLGDR